jgi:hypothetical protein
MKKAMAGGMILSAALLALVMPQSEASLGVSAQTPSGSALTVEALDNATYQPVETDAFGDSPVQLTNGSYSSIWHEDGYDQPVIISQISDTYTFGDLNGDGADDAAAIVSESTTGTVHGIFTVLAVYVNDGGHSETRCHREPFTYGSSHPTNNQGRCCHGPGQANGTQ